MTETEPEHSDFEDFKNRIDFARLGHVTGIDGVRANWEDLRRDLISKLSALRLFSSATCGLEPGLVEADWTWTRGRSAVSIQIFVSGAGHKKAQQKLLSLGSGTTMIRIPYELAPSALGDLAIYTPDSPSDAIIWVYRNVCVCVRSHGDHVDVRPIARAVQKFMEARLVARIAQFIPRVERVDVSSKAIRVGEECRLSLQLGGSTIPGSVLMEMYQIGEHWLEIRENALLTARFLGKEPGQARVDVDVIDRETLLSLALVVTVDVLPAE